MDYRYMGNRFSFNKNTNSFNTIFHSTVADDKPQVLKWLSSLEPQKRHQYLRDSRLEDVGQWVFRTSEFQRWNTGEDETAHPVLFCHGDPGVGKTHLSSLVIDHFYGGGQDISVAGLYCDYLDSKEQTTSNMLGGILKRLVGSGDIPEDIRKAFKHAKDHFGEIRPRVPELLNMLKTVIAQRQRVVISIDGLDESPPAHRTSLLRSLQDITRELPNARLFLTGRSFVQNEVMRYFPGAETILVRPTKEDTRAFLRMKLSEDTEYDAMDDCLRADIMEIIPEVMADMFLLVSLSIDSILAETTIHRRKRKLKRMSRGYDVGDIYTATLERVRAQKKDRSRLGMEAIMWVAHSERPLEPDELCQALGVELGSKDLNIDNVPSIRTVLSCGLGLVTVDSSSSTVRLVHFTLQEYILANYTLFQSPHSAIAEVCLSYLDFACIRDLSPALPSSPATTPFLAYASCYWGAHARREKNEDVISLALKLLDQFDTHISSKLLLFKEHEWNRPFNNEDRPLGFTGLHGAALFGVADIIVALFEIKKWDPNATDFYGNTALAWAAREGHDSVVQLLLREDSINPDIANKDGRTPFSWAAGNGCGGVVTMLLERSDANPNTADKRGRTPFAWATLYGREGIVKMLLERNDVSHDTSDESGRTPFSWAALYGREGIVKMLLGRNDVNPDTVDTSGRTPLSWAAEYGHEEIMKMLLERNDVKPDTADVDGQTPFSWAVLYGHEGIVKMLLERNDANPDTVDEDGRTPFSWAAGNGHAGIVKMLLERNDVNPDTVDESGRTPFSWAAGDGRVAVVKVLLERNDVNPGTEDKSGRSPFSWATWNGHAEIVKMLLERNDANPDMADGDGQTPLSLAAEDGNEGIVKILLERNDVNPDTVDGSGRTPLSWAAGNGHEGVVKILLERSDVNPDTADKNGRTQFSWAAENGHEVVVKMLLERNDVNPDTSDESGRTPFSWAALIGRKEIVRMLLERNDVNPDTVDESGRTPLSWAAEYGHAEIVEMLFDRNDVQPDTADKNGRTPFSWAALSGHEGIFEKLLERSDVNTDTTDAGGQTPFPWAAGNPSNRNLSFHNVEHDLFAKSTQGKDSFDPLTTELSELPEPPPKRVRRF